MDKTTEQLALEFPQLRADIDWCYERLFDICRGTHEKAIMSVPPRKDNFDMQMSAAFDELKAYRAAATLEQVQEWAKAKREHRLQMFPVSTGRTVEEIVDEYFAKLDAEEVEAPTVNAVPMVRGEWLNDDAEGLYYSNLT